MKKIISLMLLSLMIIMSSCGSSNQYMIKDTAEYSKLTKEALGEWNVKTIISDKKNMMEGPFSAAEANVTFSDTKISFVFHVNPSIIDEKSKEWKDKWPDIVVTDYIVTISSDWEISKSGTFWFGDGSSLDIDLKGTGENFEGFWAWEKTKFAASSAADGKNLGGGLAGMMAGKLAAAALKTVANVENIKPTLPGSVIGLDMKFNADKSTLKLLIRNDVILEFTR